MMNVLLLFPRNPLVASTQPPATEKRVQPAATTPPAPFNLLQGQTVSQTGENVPVIKRYVSPRREMLPLVAGTRRAPRL